MASTGGGDVNGLILIGVEILLLLGVEILVVCFY